MPVGVYLAHLLHELGLGLPKFNVLQILFVDDYSLVNFFGCDINFDIVDTDGIFFVGTLKEVVKRFKTDRTLSSAN